MLKLKLLVLIGMFLIIHHKIAQGKIIMCQIVDKKPTELRYVERSVFMKEVKSQNFWTFELGTQEGINVPIRIIVGFQQSDRPHDQNLNNDTF